MCLHNTFPSVRAAIRMERLKYLSAAKLRPYNLVLEKKIAKEKLRVYILNWQPTAAALIAAEPLAGAIKKHF